MSDHSKIEWTDKTWDPFRGCTKDSPGCEHSENAVKTYYWIAINGPSVAMSSLPLPTTVEVRPVPQVLLGFDSAEEASEALHFFLTASIPECKKRLRELARRAKRGEIVNIEPDNPEPPIVI